MRVKRLIEELSKFNPDAIVKMHHRDDEPVLFVLGVVGDNERVWLESESDNDMGEEIMARFENAIEEGIDELDVYTELLDIGIDVDMVRRHTDDETADHMQKFCEEHGLI